MPIGPVSYDPHFSSLQTPVIKLSWLTQAGEWRLSAIICLSLIMPAGGGITMKLTTGNALESQQESKKSLWAESFQAKGSFKEKRWHSANEWRGRVMKRFDGYDIFIDEYAI